MWWWWSHTRMLSVADAICVNARSFCFDDLNRRTARVYAIAQMFRDLRQSWFISCTFRLPRLWYTRYLRYLIIKIEYVTFSHHIHSIISTAGALRKLVFFSKLPRRLKSIEMSYVRVSSWNNSRCWLLSTGPAIRARPSKLMTLCGIYTKRVECGMRRRSQGRITHRRRIKMAY